MKRFAAGLAVVLLFAAMVSASDKTKTQTFTGEIMDSQCSAMGSHAEMLKKEGKGDMDAKMPQARKMCTEGCVKMGGKLVLYNASDKTVYELDDQTKPAKFAGESVKIKGTLDGKTIKVRSITKA